MSEPQTESGRKLLPWLAGHFFNGNPAEAHDRALADILAIEREAVAQTTSTMRHYIGHRAQPRTCAKCKAARALLGTAQ